MAKFYVGQRVKCVRGGYNEGVTGVVACVDPFMPFGMTLGVRLDAGIDAWSLDGTPMRKEQGSVAYGNPDDFEPIQPEGWRMTEWSKCLWQPNHMTAPA